MSRRSRAMALLGAAILCAALAALLAGRYRSGVEGQYGPLRTVLVASADLPAGTAIGPEEAARSLSVRRVPAAFVPPGALRRPADALGQAPGTTVPAGSYVLAAQLAAPQPEPPPAPRAGKGRRPVQLAVIGVEALLLGGGSPEGGRVDVIVSQRSGLGTKARADIAISGVPLLALSPPKGPGASSSATLALTSEQALELISAEAAGKQLRLLGAP